MLTCFCAKCGGAVTIRTGKRGRYRHNTCSIKARQGETGCAGRSIPMEKLGTIVAGHIEDRLLQPDRLGEVLAPVLDRRHERAERRQEHIAELNRRAAETDFGSSGSMTRSNQAFAQRVEVGEAEVRIMGSRGALLCTASAVSSGKSAGIGVPSLG